jgi:bla regulator protein BlaR1
MIILEKVFVRVLYSSLTATVIVLLVLFLKRIFKERFSPRFYHILWLLVLIRLLVPFAPESNLSIFNLLPSNNRNIVSFGGLIPSPKASNQLLTKQIDTAIDGIKPILTDVNGEKSRENYFRGKHSIKPKDTLNKKETNLFQNSLGLFFSIWFIGFLSMTVFVLGVAFKFKKNVKYLDKVTCPETKDILNNCRKKLALNKQVELFYGKEFESPFIFGILKPSIYLPTRILSKVTNQELYHILIHELSHYKRKDLLCNLLSILAVMLHWFNPIVWFAMKNMRADIECACDMYVLENLKADESIHYGRTIIKLSGLLSRSQHNKMLYAYFYEGKEQIERRITMIKMFKKGTYRLTAIAIAFFIALGCCTLTNAETGTNGAAALTANSKSGEAEFRFDEPYKNFFSLDRAMDFIDFDFKVPDKIPSNYEFNMVSLDEEKDLVRIDFGKIDGENKSLVSMLVSNNDMAEYLKEKHSDVDEETVKTDIKFSEELMNILNIDGRCLTIYKDWEWSEKDIAELQKDDKAEEGLRVKRLVPSEQVDKYFIWQDNNIWYSIPYYNKTAYYNDRFNMTRHVSEDDMKILVSSLKYPKEIQNAEYVSKNVNRLLEVYDNKDLKTAEEILGFTPKFPLNLPGGFVPTSSRVFTFLYDGEEDEVTAMDTTFQLKDKNSIQELNLNQTKNISEYDDIAQKGYISSRNYSIHSVEENKIKVNPITIDGIKVLAYERNVTNPNILSQGITTVQYYMWKQNDNVYEAQFVGDMGNQQEIVKALINNTH